jgi:hypothetical protein
MNRHKLALTFVLGLSVTASTAHAASVADVRKATTLRQALKLAKKVPGVKQALKKGAIVLSSHEPTKEELSSGSFDSIYHGGWGSAGYKAQLVIDKGWFGMPRVQMVSSSRWVRGIILPGAGGMYLDPANAAVAEKRNGGPVDPAIDDKWQVHWQPWRVTKVATWKDNVNVRTLNGPKAFPELTPATIADALEKQLKD